MLRVNKKSGKYFRIDAANSHIKSYDLINIISSDRIEFSYDETQFLPSVLMDSKSEIKDISLFDDSNFVKYEVKPVKKDSKEIEYTYFYADTETDVVSYKYHKAFCISYQQRGENEIHCIIGEDCTEQFLNALPNNSVVYFHNLGYDSRMFSKYVITSSIDKGSKTMNQKIKFDKKTIIFKDSYSILSMKLANFPKAFKLQSGAKEMFPYKYYTFDRLLTNVGKISEAGKQEIKRNWNQEQFEKNIESLKLYVDEYGNHSDIKTDYFNMKEYVKFYCNQDVNILAQGFDKFRNDCLNELNIDVDKVLTAPSLANKYFEDNLYYHIPNFYKYSGIVRAFIQKAVYGGRCMTRDNEKWKTFIELCDFDAVSLYPSAMNRLYCQTGKPTILNESELSLEYLLSHTAGEQEQPHDEKYISTYVVEIEITNVKKHLHFPLIVVKDKKTNTNRNTNDAIGHKMVVDNIMLEDLVNFQGVECKIIRGYKWTDNKDLQIKQVIRNVFNKRLEHKKNGNPLQEVYKLIMNSAYGKTIQKPIKDKSVYKLKGVPTNKYMVKNSAKVLEINPINDKLNQIKVSKPVYDFCSNTLLGVQILSMSKRIMNEVMCLAEYLGIKIFYQDTDSMHIEKSRLDDLATEYKKRYNRELIGKDMGQFHNDFDELPDSWAYQSIFNGKKCYIDMLTDDKGNKAVHKRAKGVTLDVLDEMAEKCYNNDLFALYDDMFDEKSLKVDLTSVRACFKSDKTRQEISLSKFPRTLHFKGVKHVVKEVKQD